MNFSASLLVASSAVFAPCSARAQTTEVHVPPGATLQAAIDACAPGTVIRLSEGFYPERITIEKPLMLIGAGWDKTVIGVEDAKLPERKKAGGDNARNAPRRGGDPVPYTPLAPTVTVRNAKGVVLQGLRIRGPEPAAAVGSITEETLVAFDGAAVTMSDCAVLGPAMHGVTIRGASDVTIERSLVAAFWGTGVQVSSGKQAETGVHPRALIVESDIRNCYHRGVTIASNDASVERCRISGSAWHGIRYDNCAPTIRGNQIFKNARSGIYASTDTAARVTGNVFWKNEMNGMSCWFKNADSIEGNTFVGNSREAIAVLRGSRPTLSKNAFADNPIAVAVNNATGDKEPAGVPAPCEPTLSSNLFWANPIAFQIDGLSLPLPAGNETADPRFRNPGAQDFTSARNAPVGGAPVGAADPVAIASPFPIQPEERSIIPDGDGRGFTLWKP